MEPILEVTNIHLVNENASILKNVTFQMKPSERLVIAGETGSGKTSLLKVIGGLLQAKKGEVKLSRKKVWGPDYNLVSGHERIAYLSQTYELPKFLRVEQILEYSNALKASQAARLFSLCKIQNLLKRKTNEVSGGEKQRIALARVLISSPKLLLLDEPFSNLDPRQKKVMKEVIDSIIDKLGISCIMVSHDPADTLPWADRLLILKNGKLIQEGRPREIFNQPQDIYTCGLFGAYSILPDKMLKKMGLKSRAKRFFRPGDFCLSEKKKPDSLSGVVEKISYLGSSFEIEVMADGCRLIVESKLKWKKNQKVFVYLAKHSQVQE